MKFSTILAVLTVAVAVVSAGCKYDKAAKGGAGDDGATQFTDIEGQEGADQVALSDLAEKRFEDYCTKCTDVDFTPVYFGFDSSVVPQGELGKIEQVADHLRANADRVVVVEGNCDERGSREYNAQLGQNRAAIVRNYLVQNEIAADRIQMRSYGSERPAVDGHDESAWAKNRRGEFAIYKK